MLYGIKMRLLLILIAIILSPVLLAQTGGQSITVQADSVELTVMPTTDVDGDTLAYHNMDEFAVVAKSVEYRRMEYRVRQVYPYAILATSLLEQFLL